MLKTASILSFIEIRMLQTASTRGKTKPDEASRPHSDRLPKLSEACQQQRKINTIILKEDSSTLIDQLSNQELNMKIPCNVF